MNIWHDIDEERIYPTDFMAVVEISMGSNMKYELDKKTGMLSLDRVLFTATHYPMNYGFIPRTYADDHDPLDVLLLCSEPILPMTLVRSYPIGVMTMEDGGMGDEKIIAIPYIGDTLYTDAAATRSMYEVALACVNDANASAEAKAYCQTIVDSVTNAAN